MTLKLFILSASLLCLSIIGSPSHGFDRIVIFGDSLSDTGNLTQSLNLPPPYFNNRISNGPVAVDVLANSYGLNARTAGQFVSGNGDNFAVSGGNAAGNDREDLKAQISAFRIRNPQGIGSNTLAFVVIGGNDLRDARNFSSVTTRRQLIQRAVNAIAEAVITLNQLGARYILVSNGPDISRIPETLTLAETTPSFTARSREVSLLFNNLLSVRLAQLSQNIDGNLKLFDLSAQLNSILNQPTSFGFTVNDRACFDPRRFRLNPGCNFDQFVFFDSIHPTAKTHAILGNALVASARAIKAVQGQPVTGALILLLE